MSRRVVILTLALLLTACSSALRWNGAGADSYVVQPGDTLYSIAWRYNLDYHNLAAWNDVGSDYLIYPGQTLQLHPGGGSPAPATHTEASAPTRASESAASTSSRQAEQTVRVADSGSPSWQWPVDGRLLARFHDRNATGKGIDIGGSVGDEVDAAAGGKVVYSGSGLIGYGKLIIIDHNGRFLSAYAHNSEMYVEEGDRVNAGERIAAMGVGPGQQPMLHFEIRVDGKPVDPLKYLPRR